MSAELGKALAESGFIQPKDSPSIPTFKHWEMMGGIYVDDTHFCREVLYSAKRIDCVCYTCTSTMLDVLPVRRILTARMQGIPLPSPKPREIRHAKNVHTKLYLVTEFGDKTRAWVGSMNLVTPGGWHNVMLRAHRDQTETFRQYFERIWSLSSIYKHD